MISRFLRHAQEQTLAEFKTPQATGPEDYHRLVQITRLSGRTGKRVMSKTY